MKGKKTNQFILAKKNENKQENIDKPSQPSYTDKWNKYPEDEYPYDYRYWDSINNMDDPKDGSGKEEEVTYKKQSIHPHI